MLKKIIIFSFCLSFCISPLAQTQTPQIAQIPEQIILEEQIKALTKIENLSQKDFALIEKLVTESLDTQINKALITRKTMDGIFVAYAIVIFIIAIVRCCKEGKPDEDDNSDPILE